MASSSPPSRTVGSKASAVNRSSIYTIPGKQLAPKVTAPEKIKGKSTGIEINNWSDAAEISKLLDEAVGKTTK